jgi:hypothetical protein
VEPEPKRAGALPKGAEVDLDADSDSVRRLNKPISRILLILEDFSDVSSWVRLVVASAEKETQPSRCRGGGQWWNRQSLHADSTESKLKKTYKF